MAWWTKEFLSLLVRHLGRSSLPLNRLLWSLMTVCRGWLTLSIISNSLSRTLISATVTTVSSFAPTTEPARLISLSSLDASFLKMALNSEVTIKAANGKTMKALKVFTEALTFLKDDALQTISKNTADRHFIASDFIWVLTVPAIWDASAKQFMREAATQAGIVTRGKEENLLIALEPEVASVWCKRLPADGFLVPNNDKATLDHHPGTQYIVIDCGGGTIDITVHEVLEEGSLKELHKASGNDLGGQTVDKKFKEFLREIFCDGVWDEYEESNPSEVQEMMYKFTFLKQVDDEVQLTCPYNLGKIAQERKAVEEFFKAVSDASWDEGSMIISRDKLRSFFDDSLNGITKCLTEILQKDLQIQYILIVGGFAESKILRQHVYDQFGSMYRILCPVRPQEAILKGALMYGLTPELVVSRKSAFTYGLAVSHRFDASIHKQEKKFRAAVGELCSNIFMKLVEEGEDVGCHETRNHIFYPAESYVTSASFIFYRSESKNPVHVDDYGVQKVASFRIALPDTTAGTKRKVKLEIKFGSTEITATATDQTTGSKGSTKIDFMIRS
ncbi:heat shock 70 kDa protein 12A-like isoform 2-T2 [Pholidichthys leucotaenia]